MDTATATVTVSVADGLNILAEASSTESRRHGEELAPAIAAVLGRSGVRPDQLTCVVVGVGPGPFTGLRVGLMTARTLALALDVPVLGICTLDVLAFDAVQLGLAEPFIVATDARRKEVYWAAYDDCGARIDGPFVSAPARVSLAGRPAVGAGAVLYPEAFPDVREPAAPKAAALCRWVALGRPTVEPLPLYLRRPDATEPGARKPVTSSGTR